MINKNRTNQFSFAKQDALTSSPEILCRGVLVLMILKEDSKENVSQGFKYRHLSLNLKNAPLGNFVVI
jgi:hypothetical protein